MKRALTLVLAASLAACGIETATTAATVAEMKRREMEQAKKTMEAAKSKIEQNVQQSLERQAQTEEKAKD